MASFELKQDVPSGCFGFCSGGETRLGTITARKPGHENLGGDAELAKEVNQLSLRGRKLRQEFHAAAEEQEETSELVAGWMSELEEAISKLPKSKRGDLDRAIFLKPSLQKHAKFNLMFLRSVGYKPRLAAERMARYFTLQRSLFGEDKLGKNITLEDMDDEDMEVIESGIRNVVLPYKDRAGRPIWLYDDTKTVFGKDKTLMRWMWYQIMVLLEDEVTQQKGIAVLKYSLGTEVASTYPAFPTLIKTLRKIREVTQTLPIRVTSFHYCYDDPVTHFLVEAFQSIMSRELTLRLRTHFGSSTELKYSLQPFGVPVTGIILTEKGEKDLKPVLIQRYLRRRRAVEKVSEQRRLGEETRTGVVSFPNPNDILLGRGSLHADFPGNQRLALVVDYEWIRYSTCDHDFQKGEIVVDVIKTVQDWGGRFLKRTMDSWVVADDRAVTKMIRRAFRNVSYVVSGYH